MLGTAQSIAVQGGETASTFISNASRDPGKAIHFSTEHDHDVLVAFDHAAEAWITASVSSHPEKHCILGLTHEQVRNLGGCNAVYRNLCQHFTLVFFYWLPNPVVPWIEPLPGPRADVSILVETRTHA
jgi:hypothetical protein